MTDPRAKAPRASNKTYLQCVKSSAAECGDIIAGAVLAVVGVQLTLGVVSGRMTVDPPTFRAVFLVIAGINIYASARLLARVLRHD